MERDLIDFIEVETTGRGVVAIRWQPEFTTAPVTVTLGRSDDTIDRSSPVVADASSYCVVSGLEPGARYYFRLDGSDGRHAIVAERGVPIEGAVNFRDLGGYATDDGRRVRWGRLFRSGHLSKLTDTGLADFTRLGVEIVCDFRLVTERANEDMQLPDGIELDAIEIPPAVKDPRYLHRVFAEAHGPDAVADAMHEIMLSIVRDSADRYRRLFEVLLAPEARNILLNCSAGKERTGIGTALVLTALGVPRETIYHEYMLSRIYFPVAEEIPRAFTKYEIERVGDEAVRIVMPLLETRRSYLEVAFDYIDREYGDGIAFLRARCGLGRPDIAALRERYTA